MRLCNRNKQTIYYATYVSKSEITDASGNKTGQYITTYSAPVKTSWNISFDVSDSEVEMFGVSSLNVLRIVAQKNNFPLSETSIIWFNKIPDTSYVATSPKNNYKVVGIKPSLNELVFYAQAVNTS